MNINYDKNMLYVSFSIPTFSTVVRNGKKRQVIVQDEFNVLLDKNTNSSFNDSLPEYKTKKYFDLENVRWSLKLQHTVSVFTQKEWREHSIIKNQEEFLAEFKKYYEIN